jgi:hypothetical protein
MGDVIVFKDRTIAIPSRLSDNVLPPIPCQCCIHVFQTLALDIAPMLNNPLLLCVRRHRHRGLQHGVIACANYVASSSMPSGNAASHWVVVMQQGTRIEQAACHNYSIECCFRRGRGSHLVVDAAAAAAAAVE